MTSGWSQLAVSIWIISLKFCRSPDAGVSKIIPHIYSSIIDKVSGNTRPDDVRQLMAMTRACVG